MPDPQRCCVIGLCCPPGSPAQRRSLEHWLRENFHATSADQEQFDSHMKETLDRLPWDTTAADFDADGNRISDSVGEAV